ncbi:MAG: hypothetical protein NTX50_26830 [Candidatus Sumerlaeota bacterium]|nr:hypothetical protein [Candidatus Sumerlaeota bacterium]
MDKIRVPVITHDEAESQRRHELLTGVFGDLLRIEMRGVPGAWFAPWDALIQWWGVQEAMMDLAMRPELMHHAMDRLVTATLARLDQWEQLNLLSLNNNNVRVGSGGPGSGELTAKDFNPGHVRPCKNMLLRGATSALSAKSVVNFQPRISRIARMAMNNNMLSFAA